MSQARQGFPKPGPYVRFYNVTGIDKPRTHPFDMFDFMPCKSKLALQRGPSDEDHLPAIGDSSYDDVDDIYVSGQANYQKFFDSKVVSRSHAAVRWMPAQQQPTLTDQGSTHGTYLTRFGKGVDLGALSGLIETAKDVKKLDKDVPTPLQDGDLIQLGKSISRGDTDFTPLLLFVSVRRNRASRIACP
jgi:hypothetical protein